MTVRLAQAILHISQNTIEHYRARCTAGDQGGVGNASALDLTLTNVNGVEVSLGSFKGTIVLLNFWATWCGPCHACAQSTN